MIDRNLSDSYDLLRRARVLIEHNKHDSEHAVWLADFKNLPGAKLPKTAVRILRDPHRRLRGIGQEVVMMLLKKGYLQKVITHAGRNVQLRRNQKGREALQLRSDVE